MTRKLPKVFLFTIIVLIALLGCATTGEIQDGKHEMETTIEPTKANEDCVELSSGQVLDYTFESLRTLDFNIHWHEDNKIS